MKLYIMLLDLNVAGYLTLFIAEQMNKDNTLQAKSKVLSEQNAQHFKSIYAWNHNYLNTFSVCSPSKAFISRSDLYLVPGVGEELGV